MTTNYPEWMKKLLKEEGTNKHQAEQLKMAYQRYKECPEAVLRENLKRAHEDFRFFGPRTDVVAECQVLTAMLECLGT